MNKMRRMMTKTTFSTIIMLCCLTLPTVSHAAAQLFDINPHDRSLYYLSMFFGNVGEALINFSETNLLSAYLSQSIFGFFNGIVLSVATVLLTYTTIMSSTKTAQEGELFGRQWSTIWTPIRSVLGLSLLAPTAYGYSAIQVIIMWAIVQGVGAANALWNVVLDEYEKGYSVTEDALLDKNGEILINAQNSLVGIDELVTNVIVPAAFCAAYHDVVEEDNPFGRSDFGLHLDTSKRHVYFRFGFLRTDKKRENKKALDHSACGEITIKHRDIAKFINSILFEGKEIKSLSALHQLPDTTLAVYMGLYEGFTNLYNLYYPLAFQMFSAFKDDLSGNKVTEEKINEFFDKLEGLAEEETEEDTEEDGSRRDRRRARRELDKSFLQNDILVNYQENTSIAFEYLLSSIQKVVESMRKNDTTLDDIRKHGWFFAGSFYMNMSKTPIRFLLPSENTANTKLIFRRKVLPKSMKQGKGKDRGYISDLFIQPLFDLLPQSPNYTLDFSTFAAASEGTDMNGLYKKFTEGKMFKKHSMDLTEGHPDPIISMREKGSKILFSLEWATNSFMLTMFGIMIVGAVFSMASPVKAILELVVNMLILPIFGFFVTALLGAACLISTYIPMIPYYLFLFGGITWFFLVIEAMIGGPLLSIAIMFPSQQSFQKALPAIVTLIGVVFRPALMVIGFVTGAKLVMVAYDFLNVLFMPAFDSGAGRVAIFAFPIVIAIYGSIAVAIAHECWSLIFNLPDKAMRWIGGQIEHTTGQQLLDSAKQSSKQGAEKATSMAKGALSYSAQGSKAGENSKGDDKPDGKDQQNKSEASQ